MQRTSLNHPRTIRPSALRAVVAAFVGALVLAGCGTSGADLPKSDFVLAYALRLDGQTHVAAQADPAQDDAAQDDAAAQNDLNGADLAGSASVTAIIDESIPVQEVRFFLDEELVHTTDRRPFTVDIDTTDLSVGTHVLMAEAVIGTERPLVGVANFRVHGASTAPAGDAEDGGSGSGGPVVEQPDGDSGSEEPVGPDFFAVPEATLFVSPEGSDGNDGRSPERALRTIQAAADRVQPGDVVYLRGGVYTQEVKFRRSGTEDQPIVWTSAPGEWAVIDLGNQTPGASKQRVWVYGASHNQFLNFEVRNSPNQGIYLENADHHLFRNIVTHHNHGSGIHNYRGSYNRYEYVTSHDNYDHSSDRPGEDADGIGIKFGAGNEIYASVVYNNSDDGFDTWQSTNTVIDSSISHHNGYGAYGNGNGFKLGSSGHYVDTIVRNSIAYANNAVGFTYNGGHGVTFLNNTSVENRRAFEADSTATLVNNIALGGDLSLSGADSRSNTWDLDLAPDFISTNPGDRDFLALAPDSPALNAGEDGRHLGALQPGTTYAEAFGGLDVHLASVVMAGRR